jgi:hypothetical protein
MNKIPKDGSLDTLALSGTSRLVELRGKGSCMIDKGAMRRRAKKKMISQSLVLATIDIAKNEGNSDFLKKLWNTYHCQERLYSYDNKIHGTYCKNRICTICNGNRKADIINRYLPIIRTWESPHFLTLSVKSVPADILKPFIKNSFLRIFRQILEKHRKRYQRGNGPQIIGVRSLECNFNPSRRTYNPHLHIIIPTKQIGRILQNEWRQRWEWNKRCTHGYQRYIYASYKGQKLLPIKNELKSLMEVVKYGSKIFTEFDPQSKRKQPRKIYVKALYNILYAFDGIRLFERFGFNLPRCESNSQTKFVSNPIEWTYNHIIRDWFDPLSGEVLSDFSDEYLAQLLIECQDHETE